MKDEIQGIAPHTITYNFFQVQSIIKNKGRKQ